MPVTINGTTGLSGVDGSAATPPITGTDTDSGIFFPAANTVAVTTGGTERMRIDSSGKVGIGTTSPLQELDIAGNVSVRGVGAEGGEINILNSDRTIIGMTVDVSSVTNVGRIFQSQNNSVLQLGQLVGTGGIVTLHTAATERLRIASAGNVAIGGAVPASNPKLSMYGGIRFLANETAATTYTGIGSIASDTVSISTSGTERLTIGTGGLITQLNATSGQGAIVGEQTFRLDANLAAIGPAIASFFGATPSISLETNSVYEITAFCYFTKTTAGTVTWTLFPSVVSGTIIGSYIASPITGVGAGAPTSGFTAGNSNPSFPATGSLTTGVNHAFQFKVQILSPGIAINFKFQITSSTGTVTPLAGSYYTVKKISATTGTFVA
jgi:hypothetical protein